MDAELIILTKTLFRTSIPFEYGKGIQWYTLCNSLTMNIAHDLLTSSIDAAIHSN
jgi:hypothetical protein